MARPSHLISINKGEANESLALGFLVMLRGRETFLELELRGPDVARLTDKIATRRVPIPEPSEN